VRERENVSVSVNVNVNVNVNVSVVLLVFVRRPETFDAGSLASARNEVKGARFARTFPSEKLRP